jgi:L-threonylcarbamoyladenylate synthase
MDASDEIRHAAGLIRQGRLVAFPTETVYGLGANALDPVAVGRIFEAKGRPSTSPLILHVDSVEMARRLAAHWPAEAGALAERYWPGPLTLVVPKGPQVPDVDTAGLATVGLRVPRHPLALALIHEAGVPIAAPSANRFARLSPVTAEHVRKSLGNRVDCILDGGRTEVGIESTVLSLAGGAPCLLRPGAVSRAEIEALIGPITEAGHAMISGGHPSPGMHRRHYSPSTSLVLVRSGAALPAGKGVYLFRERSARAAKLVEMPPDAAGYAAILYDVLHREDAVGWEWIAVEMPPGTPEWAAVTDRLWRAAATRPG